jgi:hypothetical protein
MSATQRRIRSIAAVIRLQKCVVSISMRQLLSKHPNPVTEADTCVAFVTDIIEPECNAIAFETKALLAQRNSEAVVW